MVTRSLSAGRARFPARAIAHAVPCLLLISSTVAHADGDSSAFRRVDFDQSFPPCLFMETEALRDEFAPEVRFRGPSLLDGGGILAPCAFFLVTGITPPNVLGFNETAEYESGGVPRDPQTILFDPPTNFVEARVGAFIEVGYPVTLTAYDANGAVVDTDTAALDQFTQRLVVEGGGITRAVLSAPGARYIADDFRYGDSAGNDLRVETAELRITLPAGAQTTRAIGLTNDSAHDMELFVWSRQIEEAAAGARGAGGASVAAIAPRFEATQFERLPGQLSFGPEATGNLRALARDPLPERDVPMIGRFDRYLGRNADPTAPRILVFTEPDPISYAPETDLDQAIRSLDLPYTVVYGGVSYFMGLLVDEGPWDLVVFDHQFANFYETDYVLYDRLLEYVQSGGRLIMSSWLAGERPSHPLWNALGFRYGEAFIDPQPVYWTDDVPRFESFPNDVPDFSTLGDYYVIDGHQIERLQGAVSLARYSGNTGAGGDTDNNAAIVLANEGRTIFRAFNDGANISDLDGDGLFDTYELWRNLFVQMVGETRPWLGVTEVLDLSAGADGTVGISIDASALTPGDYIADLEVWTNESAFRTYPVRVLVEVLPETASAEPLFDDSPLASSFRFVVSPNPAVGPARIHLQGTTSETAPGTVLAGALGSALDLGGLEIEILDVSGRRVRTLRAPEPDGSGSVSWAFDGRTDSGELLSSGVYWLSARTERGTIRGELQVLR
ncbi:MAG: FlgD immunoglobulin-like domain containing protein [Candidatus Eisenbacteria bacterium]